MLKMIAQSVAFTILLSLLFFLPAGTLAWPQGWVFIALFVGCSQGMGVWLMLTNPALLAERMKSPAAGDQKPRDRAIMAAIVVSFFAWLVFMPLDGRRFGWSATPLWAQGLGAALIVATFAGWAWVLKTNSYASTQVRVQEERGQSVISTGPYAIVRHPMYAFALLLMIGAPLLLGSLWGLVWLALFLPLLAARSLGEETVLRAGLAGYGDYAAKVRFRLIPGVW